jgi:chorismate mutase/prephenate dehydratase
MPTDESDNQPANANDADSPTPVDTARQAQLDELRGRIDAIDAQIVELISERGRVAGEIGTLKNRDNAPIYAPDREKQVYARLANLNQGPFPNSVLQAIYRELMSGSIALERPQRIAYLGPRGSFSHLAATAKFGASVEYEPVVDIAGVFREVQREHADFAVVPIENSTGGGIVDTLDAFVDSPVCVCAEIKLRVHHNLLSRTPLDRIERLYSKPQVFDQCKQWLMETGMLDKTVPASSSSRAAELAAAEAGTAALGSTLAAELYDLPILVASVEDNPHNVTRFLVLGRSPARPTGADQTVLMFTTAHKAGALVDVLDIFRHNAVNLTMITSRPSKRKNWQYYFFVDAEGHADNENMQTAIKAARDHCLHFQVLGSYPRGVEFD